MKRRQWTAEQKAMIVLSGLTGQNLGEVCTEHGISQAQFYKWKDQLLSGASKAFEVKRQSRTEAKLQAENQQLKSLVGELTLELKKSEVWE
jgi:putative transposase